jgi:hypothetical protein
MVDEDLDNIQIKHLQNKSVDHYHIIKLFDEGSTVMAFSKGNEQASNTERQIVT